MSRLTRLVPKLAGLQRLPCTQEGVGWSGAGERQVGYGRLHWHACRAQLRCRHAGTPAIAGAARHGSGAAALLPAPDTLLRQQRPLTPYICSPRIEGGHRCEHAALDGGKVCLQPRSLLLSYALLLEVAPQPALTSQQLAQALDCFCSISEHHPAGTCTWGRGTCGSGRRRRTPTAWGAAARLHTPLGRLRCTGSFRRGIAGVLAHLVLPSGPWRGCSRQTGCCRLGGDCCCCTGACTGRRETVCVQAGPGGGPRGCCERPRQQCSRCSARRSLAKPSAVLIALELPLKAVSATMG